MNKADRRYSESCVRVLCDYLRMEVDSDTLPTKALKKLTRDIEQIPARYAAVLDSDARERKQRKGGKKMADEPTTDTPDAPEPSTADGSTGAQKPADTPADEIETAEP